MGIINPMVSITTVLVSMELMSVDYLSRIKNVAIVITSGAMLQGIVNMFIIERIVPVLFILVAVLHSLAEIIIVSLLLTQHHPGSGIPPTHSGTAKDVTVAVGAATTPVCLGSGRPCLRRLHLILKFACASRVGLPMTKLALNNLNFMCISHTTFLSFL